MSIVACEGETPRINPLAKANKRKITLQIHVLSNYFGLKSILDQDILKADLLKPHCRVTHTDIPASIGRASSFPSLGKNSPGAWVGADECVDWRQNLPRRRPSHSASSNNRRLSVNVCFRLTLVLKLLQSLANLVALGHESLGRPKRLGRTGELPQTLQTLAQTEMGRSKIGP